jgi:hypothetical protein
MRRFPLEALLLFAITDKVDMLGAVKCAKQQQVSCDTAM